MMMYFWEYYLFQKDDDEPSKFFILQILIYQISNGYYNDFTSFAKLYQEVIGIHL